MIWRKHIRRRKNCLLGKGEKEEGEKGERNESGQAGKRCVMARKETDTTRSFLSN
jgi:hypothetical protein